MRGAPASAGMRPQGCHPHERCAGFSGRGLAERMSPALDHPHSIVSRPPMFIAPGATVPVVAGSVPALTRRENSHIGG